jgi:predicted helicase
LKSLNFVWAEGQPLSYRVEKMKPSKDLASQRVNDSLTLAGIPPMVGKDTRSGIVSDANRDDDPEYIVRLVGQVVKVSVETVRIVKGLPAEYAQK